MLKQPVRLALIVLFALIVPIGTAFADGPRFDNPYEPPQPKLQEKVDKINDQQFANFSEMLDRFDEFGSWCEDTLSYGYWRSHSYGKRVPAVWLMEQNGVWEDGVNIQPGDPIKVPCEPVDYNQLTWRTRVTLDLKAPKYRNETLDIFLIGKRPDGGEDTFHQRYQVKYYPNDPERVSSDGLYFRGLPTGYLYIEFRIEHHGVVVARSGQQPADSNVWIHYMGTFDGALE